MSYRIRSRPAQGRGGEPLTVGGQHPKDTLSAPVCPDVPATILREHSECYLYLDEPAASKLA